MTIDARQSPSHSRGQYFDQPTVSLDSGELRLSLPSQEPYTFYATYVAGEWDCLKIRQGDVIIDAGANIGDFTIRAAKRVGRRGMVVAVEPSLVASRLLRENLEINSIENVIVLNAVLSGRGAETWLRQSGSYVLETTNGDREAVSIPSKTLRQVLEETGVSHVDILKMDIEGAEASVLEDLAVLRGFREVAIETHSDAADAAVLGSLEEAGFRVEGLGQKDFIKNAARACIMHPGSIFRAELQTRAFAVRWLLHLMTGSVGPTAIQPSSNIRIRYASRY